MTDAVVGMLVVSAAWLIMFGLLCFLGHREDRRLSETAPDLESPFLDLVAAREAWARGDMQAAEAEFDRGLEELGHRLFAMDAITFDSEHAARSAVARGAQA